MIICKRTGGMNAGRDMVSLYGIEEGFVTASVGDAGDE